LYDLFEPYCASAPRISSRLPDKRTGKIYSRVQFKTYALPCFTELFNIFYPEGKKIVPGNIGNLLTPSGLAYWIADDGGFCQKYQIVTLHTNSYLESEIDSLISVLIIPPEVTELHPILRPWIATSQMWLVNLGWTVVKQKKEIILQLLSKEIYSSESICD
jgi:hypothetical protein